MDLDNSLEVIVHHFQSGWMICLGHQDKCLMVCVLMYMVRHWIWPMESHNWMTIRLSWFLQATVLHEFLTLREYYTSA